MKTALTRLRALLKQAPKTGIATFVLISIFFIMAVPAQINGATPTPTPGATTNQASAQYTYLAGDQGGGYLNDVALGLAAEIVGKPSWAQPYNTSTSSTGSTSALDGSALGDISNLSQFFYKEQPASFMVWAQDQYYTAQNTLNPSAAAAGINPNDTTDYAPGIGYNILDSVKGMWQVSANIVYGVLIIILILIAFLILLRQPLGGQEVVTIANSLPGIIITIVLVVFSYALCGLFIDAIYLGSNLAYNVLIGNPNAPGYGLSEQVAEQDTSGANSSTDVPIKQVLQPDDPQMSIWNIFTIAGTHICNRIASSTTGAAGDTQCAYSYIIPKAAQGNILGSVLEKLVSSLNAIPGLTNGLIELILALAIFQTAFKLFLALLNSYLVLSFYPIIAPFVFLSGALPGGTMKALDQFWKTLAAASLNFIIVYACFLLLVVLGHSAVDSTQQLGSAFQHAGTLNWVPPLLGYSQKQIFDASTLGNNGQNIITSLVIFGLYMAIPNVIEMIKEFLKVSSPFAQLAKTGGNIVGVGKQAANLGQSAAKVLGGQFFGA